MPEYSNFFHIPDNVNGYSLDIFNNLLYNIAIRNIILNDFLLCFAKIGRRLAFCA